MIPLLLTVTTTMFAPTPVALDVDTIDVDAIDRVETIADGDAQLVAYDAAGVVIGTLAVWQDSRGRIHITADYSDGSAKLVVVDGELVSFVSDLEPATLAHRNALMIAHLSPDDQQAGWVMCGATAGAAVGFWGTGNPIAGAFSTIAAYCTCADAAKIKYMPQCT